MDVSHILDHLNDQQREAVTSEKKHLMVLAGAGSGKTRVLVHKIAWEVEALNKNPSSIMAVTFTNKAALEMRSRIEELLNDEQIKPFFSSEWEVKTEQEILQKSGDSYIPDRLLIKGKEVQVIDYKTGSTSQKNKHKEQIDNYSNLLKMMGFKKVSKFIIYTEQTEKIVSW